MNTTSENTHTPQSVFCPDKTKVYLAPMEGVVDPLMRELLTSINHYDLCVTEFLRVVDCKIPKHIYFKVAPELHNKGYTKSDTPIRMQLLGQRPEWMAENAIRAIELGSHGIDLNFGCPAKTVNKSRGGAVLLKTPETIYQIVHAVKQAVGKNEITSAKIRLGFDDATLLDEIVDAITNAGADVLTVHARTKLDGYKPPAYWEYIGGIADNYDIELVANGEIWSKDQAFRCKKIAKTHNLMVGRGGLALPNIANVIKFGEEPMSWQVLVELIKKYSELELLGSKSYYFSSRLKQWLRYLKFQYPQAIVFFERIKVMKDKDQILVELDKLS